MDFEEEYINSIHKRLDEGDAKLDRLADEVSEMKKMVQQVQKCMKNFTQSLQQLESFKWEIRSQIGMVAKNLGVSLNTGKCIPITRGGGIYQEHMNEALERLSDGAWLHTFPEGKVSQEDAPIRRLKWGTASLIVRAPVTPIVLPIIHRGLEEVMPENFMFGRRPPFPLINKRINIVVGEPIEFDIPKMRLMAISMSRDSTLPTIGWPSTSPHGLDEAAQRCLYSSISEKIQTAMESLRRFSKSVLK